ncbi:MAG: hypothetical protein K8F24_11070 [Bacteroidales bacterium]|nr:hypothetical protein [Bacteroidales bacterium]
MTYIADPLFFHIIGIILVGSLTWKYLASTHPSENRLTRFLVSFGLPLALLIFSFVLSSLVLKPAFGYLRPGPDAGPLGNPWLISSIDHILPFQLAEGSGDVPSGFATRQTVLFLLTVWIVEQKPMGEYLFSNRRRISYVALSFLLLLFTLFSRYYRANHSFFALIIAVGLATLLFWMFLSVIYSLKYGRRDKYLLAETFGAFVPMSLIFLTYSEAPGKWAGFALVVLLLLALVYVISDSGFLRIGKDGDTQ